MKIIKEYDDLLTLQVSVKYKYIARKYISRLQNLDINSGSLSSLVNYKGRSDYELIGRG